jgi:hypothetical protein
MSWLTRGVPVTLAVLAAVVGVVVLNARRSGEVWHTLGQGTDTGP